MREPLYLLALATVLLLGCATTEAPTQPFLLSGTYDFEVVFGSDITGSIAFYSPEEHEQMRGRLVTNEGVDCEFQRIRWTRSRWTFGCDGKILQLELLDDTPTGTYTTDVEGEPRRDLMPKSSPTEPDLYTEHPTRVVRTFNILLKN